MEKEKEEKHCRDCGKIFEKKNRPNCPECHTIQCSNIQMLSRAKARPENYFECNNCDRIFRKYHTYKKAGTKENAIVTQCKYCGSTDIYPFEDFQ